MNELYVHIPKGNQSIFDLLFIFRTILKMNTTSVPLNTTAITKSKEQILTQSKFVFVVCVYVNITILLAYLWIKKSKMHRHCT